jgi:lysozyme family protein
VANLAALKQLNLERWSHCHTLPNRQAEVDRTAKRLFGSKDRYAAISQAVWGTPTRWWFVAIVHERDAGGLPDFDKQLVQGDPLNQVARHIPRGMGPYLNHADDLPGQDAFYRCCIDVR